MHVSFLSIANILVIHIITVIRLYTFGYYSIYYSEITYKMKVSSLINPTSDPYSEGFTNSSCWLWVPNNDFNTPLKKI